MIRKTFLLLSFMTCFTFNNVPAQHQQKILEPTLLDKWPQVRLAADDLWFYKSGDHLTWTDATVPLDGWKSTDVFFPAHQMPSDWNGLGWFRAILPIDSALFGKEMAIHGNLNGAMELYVNGVLIGTAGQIGANGTKEEGARYLHPCSFRFSQQREQAIAIRYSNYTSKKYWHYAPSGIVLFIGYPEKILQESEKRMEIIQEEDNRFYLIFGMMAALALLHLILFAYYPVEKANLVCALFFFAIAGIFLSGIIFQSESSPAQHVAHMYTEGLSLISSAVILPFFIYIIIRWKIDWLPLSMLIIGFLLLIYQWISPVLKNEYYFIFFHLSTTIGIGIILYARIKLKMEELNIILAFYFVSFLLLFPSFVDTLFGLTILWAKQPIFMNIAAIPAAFGYSFFLARGVAMTNLRLNEKLTENEILSAEKLRVEIEKQQLIEQQKIHLEQEVADRTLDLNNSLMSLKATQAQLIQQEKLASLGELTAGIAHEIQNPLNFVNNFSEVNAELIDEMNQEIDKGNMEEIKSIARDIKENQDKILGHGKRADAIVKGMLQHSRTSMGQKEPTDINALADEYLRLAYHGMRAKDKSFNVTMKTDFDPDIGLINIIPQDIGRVILNLITNAFYAVSTPQPPDSSAPLPPEGGENFAPTVTIKTRKLLPPLGGQGAERGPGVEINVSDNGPGIPSQILDKIFQPFFTTKPTGQGTGLGLSLSYDIIKAHGGDLKVETEEGKGSTFIIQLPAN